MKTKIPRRGAIATLICFVIGAGLFFFFNESFGGPPIFSSLIQKEPYEARVTFDDAEGLLPKSLVLVRGVEVGTVSEVTVRRGSSADVTFEIDERYAPLRRDASARLGRRTIFGEAYVQLRPGSKTAGKLPSKSKLRAVPSVNLDDALEVLNDERQLDLKKTMQTLARGARSPQTAEQMSDTFAAFADLTGGLRRLTDELRGQERDLAGLVEGGRIVVTALGEREETLRRIVGAGRITLEAVASREEPLDATLVEAPELLDTARNTLAHSRPLLREARPLVRDVLRAAPELEPAIEDLGPAARDARGVVDRLEPLRREAVPALEEALPAVRELRPVARGLEPALANLVPVGRYLAPRTDSATAFFANLAAATQSGDRIGKWLRLFLFFDPSNTTGRKPPRCRPGSEPPSADFCTNAYPEPGDARDNEPFDGYPRLQPYDAGPPGIGGR